MRIDPDFHHVKKFDLTLACSRDHLVVEVQVDSANFKYIPCKNHTIFYMAGSVRYRTDQLCSQVERFESQSDGAVGFNPENAEQDNFRLQFHYVLFQLNSAQAPLG